MVLAIRPLDLARVRRVSQRKKRWRGQKNRVHVDEASQVDEGKTDGSRASIDEDQSDGSRASSVDDADDEWEDEGEPTSAREEQGVAALAAAKGQPQQPPWDRRALTKVCTQFDIREREVRKLYRLFKRLDKDQSDTIDREELFSWLQEPLTVFSNSLFSLVDVEKHRELNFVEFVRSMATYAMFGQEEVLRFAFFAIDDNKNGVIDHGELHMLVDMLHGAKEERYLNIDKVLDQFDKDLDGTISFSEFKAIHNKFPFLLYPAFRMQTKIEEKTLGRKWWYGRRARFARLARDKEAKLGFLKNQNPEPERKSASLTDLLKGVEVVTFSLYALLLDSKLVRSLSSSGASLVSSFRSSTRSVLLASGEESEADDSDSPALKSQVKCH